MITRPLDLASKLRPEPRSLDTLFYVNVGLIVLFFKLEASQFVLAPGFGMDFQLPHIKGAQAGAAVTTHQITVERSGLIIVGDGPSSLADLSKWLKDEAKKTSKPTLLIRAEAGVPSGTLAEILSVAKEAGFYVWWAAEEPAAAVTRMRDAEK